MHELSIAAALIDQVEQAVDGENGSRVLEVRIKVGTLSGVDPEALRLAFPLVCEETIAAGAALAIETIPASVTCRLCHACTSPDFPFFTCDACGSPDVEIVAGREILLASIEIEE